MPKEKCSWCGDFIRKGHISLGADVYHKKCIGSSIISFEIDSINCTLQEMKKKGIDISRIEREVEKLTAMLKIIK